MRAPAITVSDVHFSTAPREHIRWGLLGFVTFSVNGLFRFDGVALRRTATGRLALAFPKRLDPRGVRHEIVKPLTDAVRRKVEAQVFAALRVREEYMP
jgi:hypothetical protein